MSLPVKLLKNELLTRVKGFRTDKVYAPSPKDIVKISKRTKIICLTFFMLLSVIIVLVPHQPSINTNNRVIGIDTHYYVDWVNALIYSDNIQNFTNKHSLSRGAGGSPGDRTLVLIFLFAMSKVVGADISSVIQYAPTILGPFLILAVYFGM
jgi:hypothetical protein